ARRSRRPPRQRADARGPTGSARAWGATSSSFKTAPEERATMAPMSVHEMFPSLRVAGAARAVDFYCQAFGATEKFRLVEPSGRIGHVELDLGGAILMLS